MAEARTIPPEDSGRIERVLRKVIRALESMNTQADETQAANDKVLARIEAKLDTLIDDTREEAVQRKKVANRVALIETVLHEEGIHSFPLPNGGQNGTS